MRKYRRTYYIYILILLIISLGCITQARGNYSFFNSIERLDLGNDSFSPLDSMQIKTDSLKLSDTVILHLQNKEDSLQSKIDSFNLKKLQNQSDTLSIDSLKQDSINKNKSGLLAPVSYEASDSMVYDASSGIALLYGQSKVSYQDMNLDAEIIALNMDSSVVHAEGKIDTIDNEPKAIGEPVYKQGDTEYRSQQMSYNFKTRKGFIRNVKTKQGDGFMQSEASKRDSLGTLYLEYAKYTTCDADCPHFYIKLSRAKVRPGKEVVFGPAHLVVADVPLPLAVPYGFFPFNKKYSSGFLMPSYGDELSRGFYLRDGGYYFAFNDKVDLKLLGEIYTKGSWGVSGETTYRKRYRYNGNFYINYLSTVEGEKNMPDYGKTNSLKVQWRHSQDAKASPNSSFSASVNFASQSYERNNLMSMYNPQAATQSTRSSSISYSYTFPSIGLSLSTSANIMQNMRDSTIGLSLPDLSISLNRFAPFKRKKLLGKEKWYEKIYVSYTGNLTNSIQTKENKLFQTQLTKDWQNAMNHQIPINATFSLLNYINITPSFNFTDRTYFHKVYREWDTAKQTEKLDTTLGFYNVYNWNVSVSANTTLYGFYVPWKKLFGEKIIAIRHVFKPNVSFTYAPNFGTESYGYFSSYVKTDKDGNVSTITYSPYAGQPYFSIPTTRTGSINVSVSNNLEMKIKSSKDSTGQKKISLIDELSGSLSYNMVNKRWSDLSTNLRLRLTSSYTFSMAAVFATYAYQFGSDGRVFVGDRTEWSYGRFGRFQGMSQNFSYTFNNETLHKLFGKKEKTIQSNEDKEEEQEDEGGESNMDPSLRKKQKTTVPSSKTGVDEDGYLNFSMPWSLSVSYGITMHEDRSKKINPKTMRYPYGFSQTLNFSGNIQLSKNWNISYSSGYDFEAKDLTMTTASLTRQLHCFSMSASVVLRPFSSYNFTFRANSSQIADFLKWEKRSAYSSNVDWY